MYDKLIAELRQHHCDAKEDDTQEICEECAYDVIIADKSVPSGIASVCVCGLMNRAADAIEDLQKQTAKSEADNIDLTGWLAEEHAKHQWIPVTERLPSWGEDVLISISGFANVGHLVQTNDEKQYNWFYSGWYHDPWEVTHWMPLPEPPKTEESE